MHLTWLHNSTPPATRGLELRLKPGIWGQRDQLWRPKIGLVSYKHWWFLELNWNVHSKSWCTVHLCKKHGLHEHGFGSVCYIAKICGSQPADLWFQARQLHVVPSGALRHSDESLVLKINFPPETGLQTNSTYANCRWCNLYCRACLLTKRITP